MEETTISLLRALLITNEPAPTPIRQLEILYRDETGKDIPFYGFDDVLTFMRSSGQFLLSDVPGYGMVAQATANINSAHIVNMIAQDIIDQRANAMKLRAPAAR